MVLVVLVVVVPFLLFDLVMMMKDIVSLICGTDLLLNLDNKQRILWIVPRRSIVRKLHGHTSYYDHPGTYMLGMLGLPSPLLLMLLL